jgi:hypothetical protein
LISPSFDFTLSLSAVPTIWLPAPKACRTSRDLI